MTYIVSGGALNSTHSLWGERRKLLQQDLGRSPSRNRI